jgi:hypothetical protein
MGHGRINVHQFLLRTHIINSVEEDLTDSRSTVFVTFLSHWVYMSLLVLRIMSCGQRAA